MTSEARRAYGTGGVAQRHEARYGCPPVKTVKGKRIRPAHDCAAPWVATLETGWTRKGSRRRKTRVRPTKRAAQAALRELLREAEQTGAPTVGGKPTVKTWAEQWLTHTESRIRPGTWNANRSQINNWIIPTIGHKRLEQLRPADVRAIERAMHHKGLAASTIARCLNVALWMLKDAIIEGHSIPQGVLLVERTAPGENDRDAIPFPDTLAILEASSTLPNASRWAAAFLQGMRPAECLGLTWGCIDFDADEIDVSWQLKPLAYKIARDKSSGFRVPVGYVAKQVDGALHLVRPKSVSGRRIIPMVPWMREALTVWREHCPPSKAGLVWPAVDGRPRLDSDDRQAWYDLTDAARVARLDDTIGRRYALYEARHTCATLLRQLGVDEETIVAIVGHASILSTKAYLHTDSARSRKALEDVADRLGLVAKQIEP